MPQGSKMGWGFFLASDFDVFSLTWLCWYLSVVCQQFSSMVYGFQDEFGQKEQKKDQVPKVELFLCANFSHLKVTYKGQYRKLYLYWKGTQFRIFWRYTQVIFVIRVSNSYPADFLHQLVFGLKLIAVKLIHDETLVDLLRFLSCQTRHSPKNLFS